MKNKRKRPIERILCLLLCMGFFPMSALAAISAGDTITEVALLDHAAYTVDIGTELADINLPDELTITVCTPAGAEGGEAITHEETAAVEWAGEYDKDAPGEYTLTAAFTDTTLAYSPMPTVRVTVLAAGAAPQDAPVGPRGGGDVNQSVVCILTPKKTAYKTGETGLFNLDTRFANSSAGSAPFVKIGIPLPETTPALSLPMFNRTGTEAGYEGVPMCTLSFDGASTNLYLVTLPDGSRRVEYTLYPGDTIYGTLSMHLPNGVSAPIDTFTLTPEILEPGSFPDAQLKGGTTSVQAQFGWEDVKKTGSTDNLGVINNTEKDPDSITYTITADSESSGLSTGRIFTERYTLTDTIDLSGLHYADGELTQSESDGVSSFFVAGVKVLEIAKPLSALQVTKTAAGGKVSGFTVTYTEQNTTLAGSSPKELANLNLPIKLLLNGMKLNPGNEAASVVNTAKFDAYSHFYDEQHTGAGYHHQSTATHTAHTTDHYKLTKTAYTDAACAKPATAAISNGDTLYYKITAENNRASGGSFTIEDALPNGLTYINTISGGDGATFAQNGQTLTWSGITIPSNGRHTIILEVKFDVTKITGTTALHNVATLHTGGLLVATASADNAFISGETQDAEVSYEKTVNKPAGGVGEPLTYTITVKNANQNTPKLITVTDKWPGEGILPTAVTGCDSFKLLDAGGTEYTLAEIEADPSIVIAQIKCYNVFVPANGSTRITISGKITKVLDELVNSVGEGTAGEVSAKTYGVSVAKAAYRYDTATNAIADSALTTKDVVTAGDVICYVMTVKNLKDTPITGAKLVDKLPTGLALTGVTYGGATGSVLLRRGNAYTALAATGDASNVQTTAGFDLGKGETVKIYLFATVSQAAIDASNQNGNKVTNAAYVAFNSVQTGDATANFYTYSNEPQKFWFEKAVSFVADFTDDMKYAGTALKNRADGSDYNTTASVWDGAYICYRLQLINRGDPLQRKLELYELIDTLPDGMEFVGLLKGGANNSYNNVVRDKKDLTGQLIRDGESGIWANGATNFPYSAEVFCRYDRAANQVHITFGDTTGDTPLLMYFENGGNGQKPWFYILARVVEDEPGTTYTNTAEAKLKQSVEPFTIGSTNTYTDKADGYRYFQASKTVSTLSMIPGIAKNLLGHHAPGVSTLDASNIIQPGESLRYEIQARNRGGTGNATDSTANYLSDFTVVDILPAEFVYHAGSAQVRLNQEYNLSTGKEVAPAITSINLEPTVEELTDGRQKLTWTFTGAAQRLFSTMPGNSRTAYAHFIAYEVDWNTDYPAVYGSYTNNAAVYHPNYDFQSVSSGSPDYAAHSISASTVVNVYGAAATAAEKSVTNVNGDTASGQGPANTVSVGGAGETVRYTLSVQNTATTDGTYTKNLVIIDELPRADNDTGVVNRVERGSEFSMFFGNTPNVTVSLKAANGSTSAVDAGNYTLRYGMSTGTLNTGGDWSQAETGGRIVWGTDSNGKNALRIAFKDGFHIQKGETVIVSFDAVTGADAGPGEIAWNSFGYSYRAVVDGAETTKIYAEPSRVGASVPGAKLTVQKVVTGDPAPADTEFTFVLKQDGTALAGVRYRLNGSDTDLYTDTNGAFTLKAGQTATLYVRPGSGYTVEEPDTAMPANFTFVSVEPAQAGDGTATDAVFGYKALHADETAGAVYTNSYTTPPRIDLTVEKKWAGDFDPNQPASVSVQLYGNGAPVGTPVTLNKTGGWKHTWPDLDSTVAWTVKEANTLPNGYTSRITGDNANGFIITNTYTRPVGTLTVSKTVTGGGNANTLFTFRFTFSENGIYPYTGSKTGTITTGGSVQLKHGESITVTVPLGVTYAVVEDAVLDFVPTPADRTYTGTINATPSTAIYTNRYEPYVPPVLTGSLTVSKAVTGDLADRHKDFAFTITFGAAGRYAYAGTRTGTIQSGDTLLLHHGDYITILGLPAGTAYSVSESGNEGYRVYKSGETGVIIANAVVTAAFTNSRSSVPLTGDDDSILKGLILMLAALAGAICLLAADMGMKRKRRRTRTPR